MQATISSIVDSLCANRSDAIDEKPCRIALPQLCLSHSTVNRKIRLTDPLGSSLSSELLMSSSSELRAASTCGARLGPWYCAPHSACGTFVIVTPLTPRLFDLRFHVPLSRSRTILCVRHFGHYQTSNARCCAEHVRYPAASGGC